MMLRSLGALTALVLSFLDRATAQGSFQLSLLHINDHHSHLASESFEIDTANLPEGVTLPTDDVEQVAVTYGGFPNLVPLFQSLMESEVNPVKLHAGDMVSGTLFYTLFEGEADAAMMNRVCFDVCVLGNHEFDRGDQVLADFIVSQDKAEV